MKLLKTKNKYYLECDIVMLPTEEIQGDFSKERVYPCILMYNHFFPGQEKLTFVDCNIRTATIQQHLYVLSDEQPEDNDWCIILGTNGNSIPFVYWQLFPKDKFPEGHSEKVNVKKIVATTNILKTGEKYYPQFTIDKSVIEYTIPNISESFILHFIEEYNKKKLIQKVLVECKYTVDKSMSHFNEFRNYYFYVDNQHEISILIEKRLNMEEELRQLFKNRSNCYADADDVIQAMDENCFVETIKELLETDWFKKNE